MTEGDLQSVYVEAWHDGARAALSLVARRAHLSVPDALSSAQRALVLVQAQDALSEALEASAEQYEQQELPL